MLDWVLGWELVLVVARDLVLVLGLVQAHGLVHHLAQAHLRVQILVVQVARLDRLLVLLPDPGLDQDLVTKSTSYVFQTMRETE